MSQSNEKDEVGRQAALTAELAADNIKKYVTMHGEDSANVVKPVNLVMKIADDAVAETQAAIDAVTKAAINNLQRYLDTNKGS